MIHPDEQTVRELRDEHAKHLTALCQLDASLSDAFKTECDRHAVRVSRIYQEFLRREMLDGRRVG